MMRTDRLSKGRHSEERNRVLRIKSFFPPISTNTFTMYKMMENIKISDLNEEKGKEYSAGGKGKHDVSEVVRKASACWWARGCWEACWWKIESWGMASIALRFKKELDLSCMWKTGKILSDFL